MRPESTSISLRRDLSAVANEFDDTKAALKFIASRAAPKFSVPEQTGNYPVMNRENFKKPANTERAEGAGYNRITGEFGSGTYSCDEHGLEYPIDDRRRRRYATFIDAENAGTRILRYQMLLAWEQRVAALYSGAGLTNTNVATAWSTAANATPVSDITTAAEKIEDATGCDQSELTLIIPRADYRELVATDEFTEQIKYTVSGRRPLIIPAAFTAEIFGIKEVLIAKTAYDSAEEGVAESNTQIWTAGVMYLCLLADDGAPLETPSAFRTIIWTADAPMLPVVESYRDDPVRGDVIRMRDDTDEVLTAAIDIMAQQITNT